MVMLFEIDPVAMSTRKLDAQNTSNYIDETDNTVIFMHFI